MNKTCKIPTCNKIPNEGDEFCEECQMLGYPADFELYQVYREEGMSQHTALVRAGIADPDS